MVKDTSCVLCGCSSRQLFQKYGYWIRECENCGHQFTMLNATPEHADQVYNNSYFEGGGAGYPNYLSGEKLLIAHGKRYGALLQRYMEPGIVLDVGSAAGFILTGLIESGWQGEGIEPNERMAEYARSKRGLQVQAGTLEQLRTTKCYDLVSMIQVIAHLYDLRQALQVAADITKPKGYWLIETSDKDSVVARLMGQNWHLYSPPSVLHYFSPGNLSALAQQFGFREVARGRPVKWIKGDHAKSLVEHKLEGTRLERLGAVVRTLTPDTATLPYPSPDLFWAIYQKQSSDVTPT